MDTFPRGNLSNSHCLQVIENLTSHAHYFPEAIGEAKISSHVITRSFWKLAGPEAIQGSTPSHLSIINLGVNKLASKAHWGVKSYLRTENLCSTGEAIGMGLPGYNRHSHNSDSKDFRSNSEAQKHYSHVTKWDKDRKIILSHHSGYALK